MQRFLYYIRVIIFICISRKSFILVIAQPVVINEVMYSNSTTLFDNSGESPDWIELYNRTDSTINLQGWSLTDDSLKEHFWEFPSVNILPHSYIIVFASGKDSKNSEELHADFKLEAVKENIYLYKQQVLQNYFNAQCVPKDLSLGYKNDGAGEICVLHPTPLQTNNFSQTVDIHYNPDKITFNLESGLYENPISLELKTLDSTSVIYYTTNGEEPDEEGTKYEAPIYIKNRTDEENVYSNIRTSGLWRKPENKVFKSTPIRVVAYNNGCKATEIINKTYFIDTNISQRYSVPIVSIITNPDNLFDKKKGIYVFGNNRNCLQHGKKWEREAYIEYFDTNSNIRIQQNIDMRIHGGTSRAAPQKSLRIIAKNKYGINSFNYAFFKDKSTITSFKTLLLRSSRDWTYTLFKDELCQYLVKDMNIDNAAANPVIVFINGEYWGVHSLREYQDINYLQTNYNTTDTLFDIISYNGDSGILADEGTLTEYNELIHFIENNSLEDDANFETVCKYIDIHNVIDYFIAESYFGNSDFPKKNLKMWKSTQNENSQWRYLFYDCDGCMIRTNYNLTDEYVNNNSTLYEYPEWSTFIVRNLFLNKKFQEMYVQRFYYHLNTTFNPARVISTIEEFEKIYNPLVVEHTLRWKLPEDYRKWKSNVEGMKQFAMQRPAQIIKELQNNFESPFIVYPNPIHADENFSIKYYNTKTCEDVLIEIFTNSGTKLYTQKLSTCDLENQDNFPVLPKGTYILNILYNNFVFPNTIVVN